MDVKAHFLIPQFRTLIKGHPGSRAPHRVSLGVCCDSITGHLLVPSLPSFPSLPFSPSLLPSFTSLPGVDLRMLPGRRMKAVFLQGNLTCDPVLPRKREVERLRSTNYKNSSPASIFFFRPCPPFLVSQLIFKSQVYILHTILGLDVKKKHSLNFNEQ